MWGGVSVLLCQVWIFSKVLADSCWLSQSFGGSECLTLPQTQEHLCSGGGEVTQLAFDSLCLSNGMIQDLFREDSEIGHLGLKTSQNRLLTGLKTSTFELLFERKSQENERIKKILMENQKPLI